ncbi:MAG: VWA domain-containing protein [Planctomycetes bacterium]|nr:VWA domain-containing protein [Planctomycetota bacterium]
MNSLALTFGVLCLVAAVPGVVRRGYGPWTARIAALLAMGCFAWAALDLPRSERSELAPRVVLLATGTPDAASEALAARLARDHRTVVDVHAAQGAVAARLTELALVAAHGPEPLELVVQWTAPFLPLGLPALGDLRVRAVAPPDTAPFALEDLRVHALGAFQAGRPGALEVRLPAVPAAVALELEVADPTGAVLAKTTHARIPGASQPWSQELSPRVAGVHTFAVRARTGTWACEGRGSFAVEEAPRVMVYGPGAETLAGALAVQGVAVAAARALPPDLSGFAVLVLTARPAAADEERLLTFVDAGGGLFLVGGEDGGGLPEPEQTMAPLSPVLRVARAPRPDQGAGPGEGRGEGEAKPDPKPEPVRPPPDPTPQPESREAPGQAPPTAPPAKGDTAGARPGQGLEETERRTVAMALLIDRSGSMSAEVDGSGGRTRMDFAKQSAVETATALLPGDELMIVAFGENPSVVLGRTEVTRITDLRLRIARLNPDEQRTEAGAALGLAAAQLAGSRAAVKHVVIVSDGEIHDADYTASMARRAAEQGITVSVVWLRSGTSRADPTARIARVGGGRSIPFDDITQVPRFVSSEVASVFGKVGRPAPSGEGTPDPRLAQAPKPPEPRTEPPKPEPEESRPRPPEPQPPRRPEEPAAAPLAVRALAESVLLAPRPRPEFPPVGGVVANLARAESRVLLVAGDEGTPLLAFVNRGLGKVGAWTADLHGAWGRAWRADPAFPGRLALWVRELLPPRATPLPGDLVQERRVAAPLPTARERAVLARLAGGEPVTPEAYVPPRSVTVEHTRGQAVEHARLGLFALCALALLEFLLGWRLARRAPGPAPVSRPARSAA